jgi:dephospho-CoA kinase
MNIAIYGQSGSGKSTIATYLEIKYNYVHCHPGARCRELALELFNTDSKAVLNALSDCLRCIDTSVWLRAALGGVPSASKVVFDGMRYEQDLAYFREHNFSTWHVTCDSSTRRERLKRRGQVFVADDETHLGETELQKAHFDVVITNEADESSLLTQVDAALGEIVSR